MRVFTRLALVVAFLAVALFGWSPGASALPPNQVAENVMFSKFQQARAANFLAAFEQHDHNLRLAGRYQSKWIWANGYTHDESHWADDLDARVLDADPDVGHSDYCYSIGFIHDPHKTLSGRRAGRRMYNLIADNSCLLDGGYNVAAVGVFRGPQNWYFTAFYANDLDA